MDRPYKLTLGSVACVYHLLHFLKSVLRIKLCPLCAVVSVVLRSEYVCISLELAAEFHKAYSVLIGPRNTIVTLDKASELSV